MKQCEMCGNPGGFVAKAMFFLFIYFFPCVFIIAGELTCT